MIDKKELETLYVIEGKNGEEIANLFGVSPQTIYNWLDKHNIKRRDRRACQNPFEIDKDTLVELYINQGKTSVEIGKMFNVSANVILRSLRKNNIEVRDRTYKIKTWNKNKPMSEEQKKILSEIAKKRTGEKAPRYRATVSEETKNKIRKALVGRYRGDDNPNWKGGSKYERNQWQSRDEYKNWRNAVFSRDNYTCQMCGKKSNGDIEAHHIHTWKDYPEKRFDIENGITLCKKCHNSIKGKEMEYVDIFIEIIHQSTQ